MSERGQKIFKIIVWIVLSIILAVAICIGFFKALNPPISRAEWVSKLEESFGEPFPGKIIDENKAAKGDFVALISMVMVGDEKLSYYTENELTDAERISIAVREGIIDQSEMEKTFSDQEALDIINRVMDFYGKAE